MSRIKACIEYGKNGLLLEETNIDDEMLKLKNYISFRKKRTYGRKCIQKSFEKIISN